MSARTPTLIRDFAKCGTIAVVCAASLRAAIGRRAVCVAWSTCPSATATRVCEEPVSSRFDVLLLTLLVAAKSKNASFASIAFATAALSRCLRSHRTHCLAHFHEHLFPGWCKMGLSFPLGIVRCGGGAAESLATRYIKRLLILSSSTLPGCQISVRTCCPPPHHSVFLALRSAIGFQVAGLDALSASSSQHCASVLPCLHPQWTHGTRGHLPPPPCVPLHGLGWGFGLGFGFVPSFCMSWLNMVVSCSNSFF